jgi:hypothetical protein
VGVSILWDLNAVILTLGYDHYNFLTFGVAEASSGISEGNLKQLDHSTDQISASAALKINSTTKAGLEASLSHSNYPNNSAADFTSLNVGPFMQAQITRFTSVLMGAGLKGYSFENGSPDNSGTAAVVPGHQSETNSGYYASIGLTHRMNRFYTDRLDAGHEDQVDALSGRTESNYIRYSSSWALSGRFVLGLGLFLEDVRISDGNSLIGAPPSDFLRCGFQFDTGYKLTERIHATLAYQFTKKEADDPGQNYKQNRVSIGFSYRF